MHGRVRRTERGLALVCALMLMVAAMAIGVAVVRGAFALLAAANNERDRVIAQAAAEAALRDGELDIAGRAAAAAPAPPARAAHFAPGGAAAFVDGCGRGADDRGLCLARSPPAWQLLDLAAGDNPALVPYGRFTGAVLAVGHGVLPARLPGYLIERIAPPGATAEQGVFYRITAIGFGARAATQVVLQSLYRLPAPPPPVPPAGGGGGGGNGDGDGGEHAGRASSPGGGHGIGNGHGSDDGNGDDNGNGDAHDDGHGSEDGVGDPAPAGPHGRRLPAGRIGWREIANWPELHARAQP